MWKRVGEKGGEGRASEKEREIKRWRENEIESVCGREMERE